MLQWIWSSWFLLIGTAAVLLLAVKLVLSMRKDNDVGYASNFPRTFDVWLPLKEEPESPEVPVPLVVAPSAQGEVAPASAKMIPLRLFTGTWNLGDAPPPYDQIREWFVAGASETSRSLPYDIIAVGSQECSYKPRKAGESCEVDWANAVSEAVGGDFELVSASSLRDSIRLLLFVNKRWLNQVHSVRSSTYSTTIPILWRKGGIGVQMSFLGTTFCFISCHLAAHASETTSRNADIAAILKTLGLGNPNFDAGHQFHHCIFMGDLNYRVDWDPAAIDGLIQTNNFAPLLEKDQLLQEQRSGNILSTFKEAPITFAPTFKVARGTRTSYDMKRTPSWCDRILTHSLPGCNMTNIKYASADSIRSSDHIPVYATFQVSVPALKIAYRDEETLRTFLCSTSRSPSPYKTSTPPTFMMPSPSLGSVLPHASRTPNLTVTTVPPSTPSTDPSDSIVAIKQQHGSREVCVDSVISADPSGSPPAISSFSAPVLPFTPSPSEWKRSAIIPVRLLTPTNFRDLEASAEIISKDAEIFELLLSQVSISLEPILHSNQVKRPGLIDPRPRIVLSSSILSIEPIKSDPIDPTKEWLWSEIPGALTKPIPKSVLAYHHLFMAVYHYKSETSETLLAHSVLSLRDFMTRPTLFELPLLYCGVQRGTIYGSLHVK